MPAIRDDTTTDAAPGGAVSTRCALGEMLLHMIEQCPLPIVVDHGSEAVFRNAAARQLWRQEDGDAFRLPVSVEGTTRPLLSLHADGYGGGRPVATRQVRVAGGVPHDAHIFTWQHPADPGAWHLAIL